MLSAQGTSGVLSNGLYVSQTIGQQSVIVIYDGTNFQFLNPPSSGNNQPTDFNSLIYTTRGF